MRSFPGTEERVESGAIQFGDDWPGLFLRGDDAFGLALNMKTVWHTLDKLYEGKKMPFELILAFLQLSGVHDDIMNDVAVGDMFKGELHDLVRARMTAPSTGG